MVDHPLLSSKLIRIGRAVTVGAAAALVFQLVFFQDFQPTVGEQPHVFTSLRKTVRRQLDRWYGFDAEDRSRPPRQE